MSEKQTTSTTAESTATPKQTQKPISAKEERYKAKMQRASEPGATIVNPQIEATRAGVFYTKQIDRGLAFCAGRMFAYAKDSSGMNNYDDLAKRYQNIIHDMEALAKDIAEITGQKFREYVNPRNKGN